MHAAIVYLWIWTYSYARYQYIFGSPLYFIDTWLKLFATQELFQLSHPVSYLDSKARGVSVDLADPVMQKAQRMAGNRSVAQIYR